MNPQYYRCSTKSGSSQRLPTTTKSSNPFVKSSGSQRVQGPKYSQPRHTPTLQEYQCASARTIQDNDVSTQGNYYLSNQDDTQYCHQTTQWNGSPTVYVSHDAMPAYQSTGRSVQNITTTEPMCPDTQYYSSDSGMLTPPGHVDLPNGCVNAPVGSAFSTSQVSPTTVAEVPMALTSSQHFNLEPSYSVDGYPSYSQSTAQENSLSFLNTEDMDNDLSPNHWNGNGIFNSDDISALIVDSSPALSSSLPLSPVSSDGLTYTPPAYANLPAPMLEMRRPSYTLPEEYAHESSNIYNQDVCDTLYSVPYIEESQNERTIRASRPHQRPLLSAALVKAPPQEEDDYSQDEYSPSPEPRSNDDRGHPHYKAKPGQDGLYHCPYAGQKDCEHKPTQQKCAYDKYLDSHLKPYRCKAKNAPQCADARFSSTACRLRHEREAHGLHGHGKMPHLCHYDGCDRAAPDNGFPRRWNLFDHMKRVHAWSPPDSECDFQPEDEPQAPAPSQPRMDKKLSGDKRKKVTKPVSHPMKKSRSGMSSQGSQAVMKIQQSQELLMIQQKWSNCYARMQSQQQSLQPGDAMGFERLTAVSQELYTIDIQYRRAQAGQVATAISGYA